MVAHRTLDVKGTLCPVPVIQAKLAIDAMDSGQILQVLATDPGSQKDIPAWAKRTGHQLLHTVTSEPGVFAFYVKKGGS
ncbi:MAG: sulfurtransferase TusA family protein [Chloroflexi bacterium]|nr:sulfurtransferase TusA family protein [Chloroflexota bacterium]